jgi:two-component system, LuxR family, response regulator FixJ
MLGQILLPQQRQRHGPSLQFALDLGISDRTVEIYRANVMTKMESKSLSQLVRMALIAGGF